MNAVIETGGKQYRVTKGDVIEIEKIDANPGDEVSFDKVLLISDSGGSATVGTPYIEDALVKAEVLGEKKGEKITVFKFKRRKGYRKKAGHRQKYTSVLIKEIVKGG